MPASVAPTLPGDSTYPTSLLQTLLTTALVAVAILRPLYEENEEVIRDFEWVYLNPAGQQLLRQPECPTASLRTLFPTAQQDGVFATCCQAFSTGQEQRTQAYYQADGLAGYCLLAAQRCENTLVVNFTDTHERPQSAAEQALHESHARQQVQTLNEELAVSNEELRASNKEYQTANTALALAQQQLQRSTQELQELEDRVRVRTQQASQQSARLSRLLAEAPAAICMLDGPELVFELVNPGYQQLFPDRELLGQSVFEALPEIIGAPVEAMLRGVYQTGTTFEGREVLMQFARPGDGQLTDRFFNFIYQARYDEAGEIDGLVVFAFEVSEQVHSRQQTQRLNEEIQVTNHTLNSTNTQLRRTNADLDTFVYTASHDLKAPIANIEGLLDALHEYLPSEAQQPMVPRLMGMMQGAIARFQQTVGHLTDVSHLHQALDQAPEEIDLASLVEGVRLDLLPLLESTQAQLLVDVAACPSLRSAPKNLRSIVYNLLSNAVKYRAPDRAPLVQVRSRCTAQQVVLEVQDNGLGLDASQQGKLFTMFKRLHTHVEGSGVGLYLIKRLIENAGGTIAVHSQLGVGSTFTVTLPRA